MSPPPEDSVGKTQWRRIAATVKPMRGRVTPAPSAVPPADTQAAPGRGQGVRLPGHAAAPPESARGAARNAPSIPVSSAPSSARGVPPSSARGVTVPGVPVKGGGSVFASTLDGTWDRRIRAGRLEPEMTIDLHGHSVASAHATLARALDRATAQGVRVILLIAGKTRGPDEAPRGAIRRELETWLAHGRHASRIASVRNAHPRHGGAGAVYVVLRRG